MKRDLVALDGSQFDLAVIGGGIFGAATVLDAAKRGLKAVLLERYDFGGATSAHSFKMIHGGIRYIQHGDIYRLRQSAAARSGFLRTAPHLARPLPIVIPTYGYGMKSAPVLRAGMLAYDMATFDRNRGIRDRSRHIPNCHFLKASEVLARYPGVNPQGLTGAGVFYDGQMVNPTRLVLAHLKSAYNEGAQVFNYLEATGLIKEGSKVTGLKAKDRLDGGSLEIRAKRVINAAGPYAVPFLHEAESLKIRPGQPFSRDAWFMVPKKLIDGDHALTLPSKTTDPDARLSRGARHLFLVPWRDVTLVGVWHKVFTRHPDEYQVEDWELKAWIEEINGAYEGLNISLDDVILSSAGLVPFGENDPNSENLRFAHRSRIIDHGKTDGLEGFWSLIGVRYTTGPAEAAPLVSKVLQSLGRTGPESRILQDPVDGGDFDQFEDLVQSNLQNGLSEKAATALAHDHGTRSANILQHGTEMLDESLVLTGEITEAIRSEMAQSLSDLVFRRTGLGTRGTISSKALNTASNLAAKELGWSEARRQEECHLVTEALRNGRSGRAMLSQKLKNIEYT